MNTHWTYTIYATNERVGCQFHLIQESSNTSKVVNYQSTEDIRHEIDSNYTLIRNIVI